MGLLRFFTGGWEGYAISAGLTALLLVPATVYLTALPYRLTIAQMERDAAENLAGDAADALAQFQTAALVVSDAARAYQGERTNLDAKFAAISRDFRHAIKSNPLPDNCRPPVDRLRFLSQAVKATNDTAAGRTAGPAVPAHP